jgi:hypothetical protein
VAESSDCINSWPNEDRLSNVLDPAAIIVSGAFGIFGVANTSKHGLDRRLWQKFLIIHRWAFEDPPIH